MRLGNHNETRRPILDSDQEISGHRLIQCRGRGGVADIWEAESPTGERVALKLVHLSARLHSRELRALEVMRRVRHPSLLTVLATWQVDDLLVISMELADRSLWDRFVAARIERLRGIPRWELLGYLGSVADAVDYLNDYQHAIAGRQGVGIQHRDLKPQNIVLVGNHAKVADFGLARVMEQMDISHTGPCTLPYAAPEYFRGRTSRRSDQYALAATYCQLRGGRVPFAGTTAQMTFGHLFNAPDLTSLPEPERPIVARALAKGPDGRWPDCRAFINALEELEASEDCTIPDDLPRLPRDDQAAHDGEGFDSDLVLVGGARDAGDRDITPAEAPRLDGVFDLFDSTGQPDAEWRAQLDGLAARSEGPESFELAASSATASGQSSPKEKGFRPRALMTGFARPRWLRIGQVLGITTVLILALLSRSVVSEPASQRRTSASIITFAMRSLPRAPRMGLAGEVQRAGVGVRTKADHRMAAPQPKPQPKPATTVPSIVRPGLEEAVTPAVAGPDASAETIAELPIAAPHAPNATCTLPAEATTTIAPGPGNPDRAGWDVPISANWGIRKAEIGEPTAEDVYRDWGLASLLPERPQQRKAAPERRLAERAGIIVPAGVSVIAGQTTRMRIRWSRDDTPMPLRLEFAQLPTGISVVPAASIVGTDTVDLALSASDQAPAGKAEGLLHWTSGSLADDIRFVVNVLPRSASLPR